VSLLPFIVIGLTVGSVYALAAVGLVITYRTSGIFNFAHGALATVAVYVFYTLRVDHNLSWGWAALISVGVLGPVMGILMDFIARPLARRTTALQVTATVGIVIAVQAFFLATYGSIPRYIPPFPFPVTSSIPIYGAQVGYNQLITFTIAIVVTVSVYYFLRFSRLGMTMRAIVDSPELVDLAGRSAIAIRRAAWVIGCTFAALSGVLLAPILTLDPTLLTLLVIQAFGAAALGFFSSLPLTFVGGLFIGVLSSVAGAYSTGVPWLANAAVSLPFIILVVVLSISPRHRLPKGSGSSQRLERRGTPFSRWAASRVKFGAWSSVLLVAISIPQITGTHLVGYTSTLVFALVFLSLSLLVRTAGMISLTNMGFAAIGAVAFSHLMSASVPWLFSVLLAGVITIPVGALVAVPAMRLPGVYLALVTLGFAVALENVLYTTTLMFGTSAEGLLAPVPKLSFIDFSSSRNFYYLVLVVLILMLIFVVSLDRSRFGRLLRAMADTPLALETLGARTSLTRLLVFCISAFIAGIAGTFIGMQGTYVTGQAFLTIPALQLLVLLMISVGGQPVAALVAAVGMGIVPTYLPGAAQTWLQVVFGLSALLIAVTGGPSGHFDALSRRRSGMDVGDSRRVDRARSRGDGRHEGSVSHERSGANRDNAEQLLGPESSRVARFAISSGGAPPPGSEEANKVMLDVRHLTVRFGGLVAVDDVSLSVPRGAITGLIGPNGAGKTTILNAVSGLVPAPRGSVQLDGRDISRETPSRRALRGLGRTFQIMQLFDSLTVQDNVALGREASLAGRHAATQLFSRRGDRAAVGSAVDEAIMLCSLDSVRNVPAGSLSTAERRLVELARCVAGPFTVLLLDEPSSGLDRRERLLLGEVVQSLVEARDLAILLIEHDMNFVMRVCASIYVLDFGHIIFRGQPQDVREDQAVRDAYLGMAVLPAEHQVGQAGDRD
jgi:ABC-type branched-subunit amino acid transport system ATPase component/branched-subunit amino acid ABC-type transport system permease component